MTPIQIRTESLDIEAALRLHSTTQALKQQAQNIYDTCNTYLIRLQEATESGNAKKLEETASHLVDILATLSPPAALDLALLLERQGRSNILTETHQTIDLLKEELNRLQKTIIDL